MRRLLPVENEVVVRRAVGRVLKGTERADEPAVLEVDEAVMVPQARELLETNFSEREIFDVRLSRWRRHGASQVGARQQARLRGARATGNLDHSLAGDAFLLGDARFIYKPFTKKYLFELLGVTPLPRALEVGDAVGRHHRAMRAVL